MRTQPTLYAFLAVTVVASAQTATYDVQPTIFWSSSIPPKSTTATTTTTATTVTTAAPITVPTEDRAPVIVTLSEQKPYTTKSIFGSLPSGLTLYTVNACNHSETTQQTSAGLLVQNIEQRGIAVQSREAIGPILHYTQRKSAVNIIASGGRWISPLVSVASNSRILGGDTIKTRTLIGVGAAVVGLVSEHFSGERKKLVEFTSNIRWLDVNDPLVTLNPGQCLSGMIIGGKRP